MANKLSREEVNAIRRVLIMCRDYVSAQPQETLTASTTGDLKTWGEIRQHINAAVSLLQPKRRRAAPSAAGDTTTRICKE